jgi:hypothetical protein
VSMLADVRIDRALQPRDTAARGGLGLRGFMVEDFGG